MPAFCHAISWMVWPNIEQWSNPSEEIPHATGCLKWNNAKFNNADIYTTSTCFNTL